MALGSRFRKLKMLIKGLEGAAIAGGGAEVVMQTIQNSADSKDHILVVFATALSGFLIKALQNYLKNKNKND